MPLKNWLILVENYALIRLRAVSLFLESPWERTQNKYACECDYERDVGAAMLLAAISVGI